MGEKRKRKIQCFVAKPFQRQKKGEPEGCTAQVPLSRQDLPPASGNVVNSLAGGPFTDCQNGKATSVRVTSPFQDGPQPIDDQGEIFKRLAISAPFGTNLRAKPASFGAPGVSQGCPETCTRLNCPAQFCFFPLLSLGVTQIKTLKTFCICHSHSDLSSYLLTRPNSQHQFLKFFRTVSPWLEPLFLFVSCLAQFIKWILQLQSSFLLGSTYLSSFPNNSHLSIRFSVPQNFGNKALVF